MKEQTGVKANQIASRALEWYFSPGATAFIIKEEKNRDEWRPSLFSMGRWVFSSTEKPQLAVRLSCWPEAIILRLLIKASFSGERHPGRYESLPEFTTYFQHLGSSHPEGAVGPISLQNLCEQVAFFHYFAAWHCLPEGALFSPVVSKPVAEDDTEGRFSLPTAPKGDLLFQGLITLLSSAEQTLLWDFCKTINPHHFPAVQDEDVELGLYSNLCGRYENYNGSTGVTSSRNSLTLALVRSSDGQLARPSFQPLACLQSHRQSMGMREPITSCSFQSWSVAYSNSFDGHFFAVILGRTSFSSPPSFWVYHDRSLFTASSIYSLRSTEV